MIKLLILGVFVVGSIVGTYLFIKNNKNKVQKIDLLIKQIKK